MADYLKKAITGLLLNLLHYNLLNKFSLNYRLRSSIVTNCSHSLPTNHELTMVKPAADPSILFGYHDYYN